MLFIVCTAAAAVVFYIFIRRVVVNKPVGVQQVDAAFDRILADLAAHSLSDHTMEVDDGCASTRTCPVNSCPTAKSLSTRTPNYVSSTKSTTTPPEGYEAKKQRTTTPLLFDKTYDPKERDEEQQLTKKHRHHHHKHEHGRGHGASSSDGASSSHSDNRGRSSEDAAAEKRHKRHKRHRSREHAYVPRLHANPETLIEAGETLPGADNVDVEANATPS